MDYSVFNKNMNTVVDGLDAPAILERLALEASSTAATASLYARLLRGDDPCPTRIGESDLQCKLSADIAGLMNAVSVAECKIYDPEDVLNIITRQAQKASCWALGVKSKKK